MPRRRRRQACSNSWNTSYSMAPRQNQASPNQRQPSMYSSRAASKAAQVSIASNSDFPRKKRISYLRLDTLLYLFSQERREFIFAQEDGIEYARQSTRALIQNEFSDNDILSNMASIKKLFSKEPYRLDTLGADYIIEKADITTLQKLASSWFVPNNACIAIAGGFDKEETLDLVAQRFGQLPKGPNPWPTGLSVFPKPGVSRPTFLVFPDNSIPSGQMQIEIRYRGPDPKETQSYIAALMLQELANAPSSRFQTAVRKNMPKGTDLQDLNIVYTPTRNASSLAIESTVVVPSGKNPADIVFSFKESVRGTELYMIRANASYFTSTEYERAREALLEKKMAAQGDPLQSAARMATFWSWGIASFLWQESDTIMKTGQKTSRRLSIPTCRRTSRSSWCASTPRSMRLIRKAFPITASKR